MSEEQLIQEIISGNTYAFKTLMEKYQSPVFRVAMGFVHSKEDAEDITQEVFIKIYRSLPNFKGDSEFSTWLYRITVNMSINYLNRNRQNRLLQSLEDLFDKPSSQKTPLQQLEQTFALLYQDDTVNARQGMGRGPARGMGRGWGRGFGRGYGRAQGYPYGMRDGLRNGKGAAVNFIDENNNGIFDRRE